MSAYGSCQTRLPVLPLLFSDSQDELETARRDNHRHVGETSLQLPSAFYREKEQLLVSLSSEGDDTGEMIRPTNTFLVLLRPLLSDSELESQV